MLRAILEKFKKTKGKCNDNTGSSVILVIMTIAFVGTLVAIVTYMSYYNHLMKYSDRSSKENFYTVETALDEINMGLQREISNAMAESYTATTKLSDKTVTEKDTLFKEYMKNNLQQKLKFSSSDLDHYQVNRLIMYLDKTRYDTSSGVGAVILTTDAEAEMKTEDDKLILKNVHIQYKDTRGYVSILKTDIVMGFPDITFASNKEVPDLEEYCLISNVRLETEASTRTEVVGNVYGGTEGIFSENFSQLLFKPTTGRSYSLVIADKISAINGTRGVNSIITAEGSQVWAKGIDVDSSDILLESNTYIADDLTVEGKNSGVVLKGNYYGYGNGHGNAAVSSSILINGAKTRMDMSQLNSLMLMGHAYVGASHYDANTTEASDYVEDASEITDDDTDLVPNNEDLILGQSVAVKSDQLMYMVPLECMGYEGETQVLAKNPITLSEYNTLTKTEKKDSRGNVVVDSYGNPVLRYDVVRLDKVCAKLGKSVNSYGVTYQPVFRKVNGSILVYYYMSFNSESMANKFFEDYYTADKVALDDYIKEYISDFKWNSDLGVKAADGSVSNPLHLAGNLVSFDNRGTAYLKSDTTAEDVEDIAAINATISEYSERYMALSTKLMFNKGSLSATEIGRTVFENIVVDQIQFDAIVPPGDEMVFNKTEAGVAADVKAMIVNNKGYETFVIDSDNAEDLYLVVATGDVRVNVSKFNGLIISGGTVSISPICINISAFAENVIKAMNCKNDAGTNFAADVLIDRDAYLNYTSTSEEDVVDENGHIQIGKLIHYENWKKE
ncbi:MAG: Rpn family recombination-promoting nuclease/putative transposase [Lachnospiraceae bacterium]|nr:Rpn family recombination-promoting nuclease/putative transposase [Lachnospiraceae bacterium]